MLRHGKIIVLLLVICLGVAGYFLWTSNQDGMYRVWMAKQDIMPGTQITENMIEAVNVDKPIVGLSKEAIINKTATVKIPKGSVVSTGIDVPRQFSGSLVNIPVDVELVGLVSPGDTVELVGVIQTQLSSTQKVTLLGQAQIAAIIDGKGQIHRYGPVNELPAVMVVQVPDSAVTKILEFITNGRVYPILGGVKLDASPNAGE